jgi:hypothetical protein
MNTFDGLAGKKGVAYVDCTVHRTLFTLAEDYCQQKNCKKIATATLFPTCFCLPAPACR